MKKEQIFSAYEAYADQTLRLAPGTISDYRCCLNKICSTFGGMLAFRMLCASSDPNMQKIYAAEMLKNIPPATARNHTSTCQNAIATFLKFKNRVAVPAAWEKYGTDTETKWIKYDPIVPKKQRVPKLCAELEEEYARIRLFAKSILGDVLESNWFDYVPVLLTYNEEQRIFQLKKSFLERQEDREHNGQVLSEEDLEIRRRGYYSYLPLGSFSATRNPPIEIYFRNTDGASFDAYLATLKNCLAHEYAHYLHHRLCEKLGNFDTYADDDLVEGIADYFAFAYSVYMGNDEDFLVALKRYVFWAKYFNSGVPYASALYFCPEKANIYLYPGRLHKLEKGNGIPKLVKVLLHCNNKLDATISLWDKL